jgi:hypothetical protein
MTLISKAHFLDNVHENLTSKVIEGMLIAHQQSASSYVSLLRIMLGPRKNTLKVTHGTDTESERILDTRSYHGLEERVEVDTTEMNTL